jgi:hypothetical protein
VFINETGNFIWTDLLRRAETSNCLFNVRVGNGRKVEETSQSKMSVIWYHERRGGVKNLTKIIGKFFSSTLRLWYYIFTNSELGDGTVILSIFSMALPTHSGPWPLIQFRNDILQSVGLLGRVIVRRKALPKHRTTQRQNKRKHPCFKLDSNPRSQRPSERKQVMP